MSPSTSTRDVSPRSILAVETPQLPDILYLRYFGQNKETETRPRGGGGGQMLMKLEPPTLDPTGPNVDSGQPRRASCPTSLSDLEGPSSSRVTVAKKRRSKFPRGSIPPSSLAHGLDRKKSKSKEALVGREVIKSKALVDALIGEDKANKATRTQSEEARDSPAPGTSTPTAGTSSSSGKAKTDAERRFEEIQRRRVRPLTNWMRVNRLLSGHS